DPDTSGVAHFEDAEVAYDDAGHLADHVGHGDQDQTDNRNQTRTAAVETVTDEIRHSKLAELAQVRRQQHRQQYIATGPAHQVDRGGVTTGSDDTCHGNEGCRGHPVRCRRHTV